ncbi:mRNA turnover protein 4 [Nematocida sp. LUAm3]|nr:mRNA turnover protein 4 [Nematocida sp. LUAm3]KAI5173681.1 mRNA turnover protein 4 [Nematocida sp. LUAm2]KAI5176902.1 mRNA turnover protein 4 [Nematocida sp. LUAm1]
MKEAYNRKERVDRILNDLPEYKYIHKILCDNKTPFIQQLKKGYRQAKSNMIFGKYKMIEKVLSKVLSSESLKSLRGTSAYKKSDRVYMYILANITKEEAEEVIRSTYFEDYEKKGYFYEEDVIIPVGDLLNTQSVKVSNTIYKEIVKLGITQVQINPKTNNLEVVEAIVLGKKGEPVTEVGEKMLKIVGIKNRKFKAEIVGTAEVPRE